jgi:formylglycine-generating enzyme required for sulfatase activity
VHPRRLIPFTLIAVALTPGRAVADHGVALLVVNGKYGEISAPVPDVGPLSRALAARGFETRIEKDLGRDSLRFTIEHFVKTAPTNGVAFVYLAGYVMRGEYRIGGQDRSVGDEYLLPVDAEPRHLREVAAKNIGVRGIVKLMRTESGARVCMLALEGSPSHPRRSKEIPARLSPPTDLAAGSIHLCHAREGLAASVARLLDDPKVDLASACRVAAKQSKGWSSLPQTARVAPLGSRMRPSTEIGAGEKAGDEWVNVLGTVFCWCPPRAATAATNARGFWLGKYELTRRELDLVTRKMPRGALASLPNHPRDGLRYNDILQYVSELNRRERFFNRLPDGWGYALPTEAEWEHACRAGTKTPFHFGTDLDLLPAHANFADRRLFDTGDEYFQYADRKLDDGVAKLAVVGRYRPNAWGFHDMHGNVWEWTASEEGTKQRAAPVARGGSWVSLPDYCRSAFRRRFGRDTERDFIGFRLALRRRDGGG